MGAYSVIAVGRRVVVVQYGKGNLTPIYRSLAVNSAARIYGPGWVSLLTYRAAFGR